MKFKNIDFILIILLFVISVISLDLLFNTSHREAIENISNYAPFQDLGTGLFITFWVCVIGNLLPVPTPYIFVVCFSSQPFLHLNIFVPLLIGFIAALGCLVGEMGGYIVGRGASEFISETRTENLKGYQEYLIDHPKVAPLFIFLFGLTPLNDDMITIPLGLIRYDMKKTIFWIWLGKLGLMLIFAYNLVNLCSFLGGENWILSIVMLYVIVIMIYLMFRVDFIKLIKKEKRKL